MYKRLCPSVLYVCVDCVMLDSVTLDTEAMLKYSGQGMCRNVLCYGDVMEIVHKFRGWFLYYCTTYYVVRGGVHK